MTDGLRAWISPTPPGSSTVAGVEVDDPQLHLGGRAGRRSRGATRPGRSTGLQAITGSSLAP